MGCTNSKPQNTEQPQKYAETTPHEQKRPASPKHSEAPAVTSPEKLNGHAPANPSQPQSPLKGFTGFKGLKVGSALLARDEFVSKYTGEVMCRWRRSEVKTIELEDRSRVLIHYSDWSDNFDFWLDLHKDWTKIAPTELLSKNQCDLGLALDEEQSRICFHYVLTGKYHRKNAPMLIDTQITNGIGNNTKSPPKSSETTDSESVSTAKTPSSATKSRPLSGLIQSAQRGFSSSDRDRDSETGSVSSAHGDRQTPSPSPQTTPAIPKYKVDEMLDIQDIFCKKGTNTPTYKWRKAKVVKVMEDRQSIRIHYINWDVKFDETLHVVKAAHRIAPPNTMTSTPELSRQQNKVVLPATTAPSSSTSSGGIAFAKNSSVPAPSTPAPAAASSVAAKPPPATPTPAPAAVSPTPSHTSATTAAAPATAPAAAPVTAPVTSAKSATSSKKKKKRGPTRNYMKWFGYKQTGLDDDDFEDDFSDEDDMEAAQARSLSELEAQEAEALAEAEAYSLAAKAQEDQDRAAAQEEEDMSEEEIQEEDRRIVAIEKLFVAHMDKAGLHVVVSEGDGNCLFRSVSHQLYMTEEYHEELRRKCVLHQMQHKERFEMFCSTNFDEHIKEMSQVGCWGDDLEIRALEEITDRIICIYSSDCAHSHYHGKTSAELEDILKRQAHMQRSKLDDMISSPIKQNFEEDALLKGVSPLCLSYHGQAHYNSVYSERIPLPLNPRKSRVLLKARMALFDCETVTVTPAATAASPNRGTGKSKKTPSSTSSNGATGSSRPPTGNSERPPNGHGHSNGHSNGHAHGNGHLGSGSGSGRAGMMHRSNSGNSNNSGDVDSSSGSMDHHQSYLEEQMRLQKQFSGHSNVYRK